ncbi:oligosaccharide repeat unit polymerase [Candidatus Gottesmanbacteria bacterium]|nr:oligosaccharide repeat unit polymerase [Candidatus Gottesmanbacteria bacterium]
MPARSILRLIAPFFFIIFILIQPTFVLAQTTPTPRPNGQQNITSCQNYISSWQPDPIVTEAGKAADRSRQLLYWVFSKEHQSIDTAPVLVGLWSFSRNIVYIFIVFVIVAFGFSYIFLKRRAMTIDLPPILFKVGGVLLFATFSYVFVLGLIQISEILMRFFIENVGGRDLFNIIFSGPSVESNYTTFTGFRDINPCAGESASTSLFLIKTTTFTYNVLAILMILRKIILWFLLILSPFLALLMPFVFIRNIGWIWIGVFFQWLFYGPMVALFLAAISRIWIAGIPYAFDFNRVNKPTGQVYKTAINILYGGPAQTLTPGNSSNYVDTYAEYMIALVMLWAAIILPWLLLRIFRDYCCAAIEASGATLRAIYERTRLQPPSPSPVAPTVGPTTTAGMAMDLPFRKQMVETQKASMEAMRDISKTATDQIVSQMNMQVSQLSDISRFETNREMTSEFRQTLSHIANPQSIANPVERERFSNLRSELVTRSNAGDKVAQSVLSAASGDTVSQVMAVPALSTPRVSMVSPQKAVSLKSIPTLGGKPLPSTVSLEDYEEVKKMWLNHYREAPVPVSGKVKDREQWLGEDMKKLTNAINLLTSSNPQMRQKGLEEVSQLLPFLLLGGFSEVETVTYLRAKLEAAKQAMAEAEAAKKAKTEAQKEKEEEEGLVDVADEKKEEEKAGHIEEMMEMGEKKMENAGVENAKMDNKGENLPKEEKSE